MHVQRDILHGCKLHSIFCLRETELDVPAEMRSREYIIAYEIAERIDDESLFSLSRIRIDERIYLHRLKIMGMRADHRIDSAFVEEAMHHADDMP